MKYTLLMEEFYCNICQSGIESTSLESHIQESDHLTRRKKLEDELEKSNGSEKSKLSVVEMWKKD
jgi:hypothetical protein